MKNTRKQSNGDERRKTVTHFGIKRLLILEGLADPRVWIQRLVSYQLDDPGIVVGAISLKCGILGASARNSHPYSSAFKSYLIAKRVKSVEALFSRKIRSEIKTTRFIKQIAFTDWAAHLFCSAQDTH
jgi:hypothetical protein